MLERKLEDQTIVDPSTVLDSYRLRSSMGGSPLLKLILDEHQCDARKMPDCLELAPPAHCRGEKAAEVVERARDAIENDQVQLRRRITGGCTQRGAHEPFRSHIGKRDRILHSSNARKISRVGSAIFLALGLLAADHAPALAQTKPPRSVEAKKTQSPSKARVPSDVRTLVELIEELGRTSRAFDDFSSAEETTRRYQAVIDKRLAATGGVLRVELRNKLGTDRSERNYVRSPADDPAWAVGDWERGAPAGSPYGLQYDADKQELQFTRVADQTNLFDFGTSIDFKASGVLGRYVPTVVAWRVSEERGNYAAQTVGGALVRVRVTGHFDYGFAVVDSEQSRSLPASAQMPGAAPVKVVHLDSDEARTVVPRLTWQYELEPVVSRFVKKGVLTHDSSKVATFGSSESRFALAYFVPVRIRSLKIVDKGTNTVYFTYPNVPAEAISGKP